MISIYIQYIFFALTKIIPNLPIDSQRSRIFHSISDLGKLDPEVPCDNCFVKIKDARCLQRTFLNEVVMPGDRTGLHSDDLCFAIVVQVIGDADAEAIDAGFVQEVVFQEVFPFTCADWSGPNWL